MLALSVSGGITRSSLSLFKITQDISDPVESTGTLVGQNGAQWDDCPGRFMDSSVKNPRTKTPFVA